MRTCFLFLLCTLSSLSLKGTEIDISRVLVSISSEDFSANEFAEKCRGFFVQIDTRNPYLALDGVFLDQPFVVIDLISDRVLRSLGNRYGYRCIRIENKTLEDSCALVENMLYQGPKNPSDLDLLTEEEQARLYKLMGTIDEVFRKKNIPYWAGRETLLGAIYYGNLRPFDDYLHLFLLDIDEEKILSLQKEGSNADLVVHSYKKGFYKIFLKDAFAIEDVEKPGQLLPFRYPAANLFIMSLEKGREMLDIYTHQSENFHKHWSFESFPFSAISPCKRVPFGPCMINIPNETKRYLDAFFGLPGHPDLWEHYVQERLWDHRKEANPPRIGAAFVELDRSYHDN